MLETGLTLLNQICYAEKVLALEIALKTINGA